MTRLLGILTLILTVIFAVGVSAQASITCHVEGPLHTTYVEHGPSNSHVPMTGADHTAMSGYCKLVCGTVALMIPSSSPVPVGRAAVHEPLPDVTPVLSLIPAPSERPPRSLI